MRYDLKQPCANCPFRSDRPFPLRPARVRSIWRSLTQECQTFACHKTVDYSGDENVGRQTNDSQMCAGAVILMLKSGIRNLTTAMAHKQYKMDAPVYESIDAMVESCDFGRLP